MSCTGAGWIVGWWIVATLAAEPRTVQVTFDDGDLSAWTFTDRKAWELVDHDGGKALALVRNSNYKPAVRSPLNIALLDQSFGSFTLDVDVRSTSRDYGHRDLCLFLGYQDPKHFYYVHLAKSADPHAHSVFAVDDAPRVSIATERTKGVAWTDGWHHLRLVRDAGSGAIRVYFDDMDSPVIEADDRRFLEGRIGLGSFDDPGVFDNLKIVGVPAAK